MPERQQEFEDALADLTDNALGDGLSRDDIISALEVRLMVLREADDVITS